MDDLALRCQGLLGTNGKRAIQATMELMEGQTSKGGRSSKNTVVLAASTAVDMEVQKDLQDQDFTITTAAIARDLGGNAQSSGKKTATGC